MVGESHSYTYQRIWHAVNLVNKGAKLIGTNPDLTGSVEDGIVPATGALMAPIELATGSKPYYVGKPNPLMMRHALQKLDRRREDSVIIGDRMDTDILTGVDGSFIFSGLSTFYRLALQ